MLPVLLSAVCLVMCAIIRSVVGPAAGWVGLICLGAVFLVLTVVVVVGVELIVVGRSYEIEFFLKYIRSLPVFRKVV